jgi:hypothetical protein
MVNTSVEAAVCGKVVGHSHLNLNGSTYECKIKNSKQAYAL